MRTSTSIALQSCCSCSCPELSGARKNSLCFETCDGGTYWLSLPECWQALLIPESTDSVICVAKWITNEATTQTCMRSVLKMMQPTWCVSIIPQASLKRISFLDDFPVRDLFSFKSKRLLAIILKGRSRILEEPAPGFMVEMGLETSEVAKHNTRASCWVIVHGKVYDVTDYLDSHPGGAEILLKHGGKDATAIYEPIHPDGTIEDGLSPERHLGAINSPKFSAVAETSTRSNTVQVSARPIQLCLNLDDFEIRAREVMSKRAWTYFHSAADDLRSLRNNLQDWHKISLRPRVLRDVEKVDMSRKVLGFRSRLPFCIAPAALAKLAHPDGERCLARGAAWANIPYCVSTGASVSHEDIATCMKKEARGGTLFFQLYINKSKPVTLSLIAKARRLGYRCLVVTVDTPVIGKREEDEKHRVEADWLAGRPVTAAASNAFSDEEKPALRGYHSSTFCWTDLTWVRDAWHGPMVIKGIQTVEDAKYACDLGVEGIYLSNHGGRQCDDAPSAIRTLLEIHRFCPSILTRTEIWVDGGIRRGTDVLKALCLGATTVLLGRPFMYALGVEGTEGVVHAIKILSDEIETTMRLIGVTSLNQLSRDLVNISMLERDLPGALSDFMPLVGSKL